MSHPVPDRSVLDTPIEEAHPEPGDEEAVHALEVDQRLAAHLRALSRVSNAASHDIRTPLHAVVLYLELLRQTLAEEPGADPRARQERYVEVIRGELESLEAMFERFVAQTRISEGKVERFDLASCLGDVIQFLEPQRRKTRIELRWTPPEREVLLVGDRDSVRHALVYLLVTAIDATPEGEEVSVELVAREDRAVIAISGASLADWIDSVLEASRDETWSRAPREVRGLRAASRVVEGHRGTIKVRSGAARATTLELQLPLGAAEVG